MGVAVREKNVSKVVVALFVRLVWFIFFGFVLVGFFVMFLFLLFWFWFVCWFVCLFNTSA